MTRSEISCVKLTATRSAPAQVWRWSYEVVYMSGARRTYTDDTIPMAVERWISEERAAGRFYELQEKVIGLAGVMPPARHDNKKFISIKEERS